MGAEWSTRVHKAPSMRTQPAAINTFMLKNTRRCPADPEPALLMRLHTGVGLSELELNLTLPITSQEYLSQQKDNIYLN